MRPYQRNPAFTERPGVLDSIRKCFSTNSQGIVGQLKYALWGLGVMGKIQIALQYAYESFSVFPVILWAHSDTRAKSAQSFLESAFELGLIALVTENQVACRAMVEDTLETAGQ